MPIVLKADTSGQSNLAFETAVARTMETIEDSGSIHPDNKEQLAAYKRDLTLDGLSQTTVQKRMAHLKVVAEHVDDRRFEDLEKDDINDLIEWV